MKGLWIVLFNFPSVNYYSNNYSLDLCTDPSLNLIYNFFHVRKVKLCMNTKSTLFPLRQLAKPGPVLQYRYELNKLVEYRRALRTSVLQQKVHWLGYSLKNYQWIGTTNISIMILQDFWT